jgi:sulfur-carrier protein
VDQIAVRFKLFSIFSEFSGRSELQINISDGFTIRDALSQLRKEVGSKVFEFILSSDTGELKGCCILFLNQKNIAYLQGLETTLHNGDVLEMIPPLSGG